MDPMDTYDPVQAAAQDLHIAKGSPLWPLAVKWLRGVLEPDAAEIRKKVAADPEGWVTPYHFYWGMWVRNTLRQHGFGEEPFGVTNLDNIYAELAEEAVRE